MSIIEEYHKTQEELVINVNKNDKTGKQIKDTCIHKWYLQKRTCIGLVLGQIRHETNTHLTFDDICLLYYMKLPLCNVILCWCSVEVLTTD